LLFYVFLEALFSLWWRTPDMADRDSTHENRQSRTSSPALNDAIMDIELRFQEEKRKGGYDSHISLAYATK
jgi:hypothetical protein